MKLRGVQGGEKERAIIERQVNHLVRLVEDLLDVSRVARGKVELRREVMDIAEVIAKTIESASPLLEQRRHQLRLDVPRGTLFVDGDAVRLAQVLGNLLINAAKYTDEGGNISVRARRAGPELVLEVSDNGIGIEPGLLPHVFDLFVQEEQGTDRSRGGLGLGLAIVRSIVKLHGGSVSAVSPGSGKGSTFTVRLPAAEVRAAAQENRQPPLPSPNPPRAAAKVFVVDDSSDGAELLAQSLSLLGYEVRMAHDGPTALRAVSDFTPDVAVLDIGLPGMDGYELASRLRALPALRRTALVALTGYGQEGDRSRSESAGFDEHLVKPVELQQLEATIARVLAERSAS